MRNLKHLFVLLMLPGLVFVQGCELLGLEEHEGTKCQDTKLDQIVFKKFQLVLQITDYAQVSDFLALRDAYKIELKATMKTYDCVDTESSKIRVEYDNETIYVKANWSFQNQFFNIGTPEKWYIYNEKDYFQITIEATAYFDDSTWYLNTGFKSDTYSGLEANNPGKVIVMLGYDQWTEH
jgi:hypothetical protein